MGLERQCSAEEFAARVADGTVEELLSFKTVKSGDVFYIPAGTIHAIGAGVLIYEIQQNSTLTYRLYDYMRRDKEGNLRELHVDKAMKVSDLKVYDYKCDVNNPNTIGKCKYFVTNRYVLSNEAQELTVTKESYMALSCVKGEGVISYSDGDIPHERKISLGDTFFAPAGFGALTVRGDMTLITVETKK
jgi:mannose-6-phosphate isomerase